MVNIPIDWTEDLENEICEKVAESTEGLHKLLKKFPHWPKVTAIRMRRIESDVFAFKYARAKQMQAENMVEQILDISDDSSRDTTTVGSGDAEREVCNNEWVNRSRLRVDSRKWYASKLAPKIYSDILPKSFKMKLDMSKSLDTLSQEILDNLAEGTITLDEAQSGFEMLEKYAELVKIKEFEFTLSNLRAQLEQQQNKVSVGEIQHGREEMDSKSNKTSGRAKKKTSRKKGKTNPRSKAKKSSAQQKPKNSKASALSNDTQEDAQEE